MKKFSIALGACLVLFTSACQNSAPPDPSGDDAPAMSVADVEHHFQDSKQQQGFSTKHENQLPGVQSQPVSDSWAEALSQLPSSDREYLQDANRRYFGALSFSSIHEQQEMERLGFPKVEEWLAARRIHDSELEKLAQAGNTKAKLFYADRLAAKLEKLPRQATSPSDQAALDQLVSQTGALATAAADEAFRSTNSPFAAYLVGYQRSTLYGSRDPTVAAMFVARDLGDHRVAALLQQTGITQVDPMAVFAVYNSMLSIAKK